MSGSRKRQSTPRGRAAAETAEYAKYAEGRKQSIHPVRGGFSFVELIGVLAILAILATLVLPRISNRSTITRTAGAVDQARVNQVLASVQAIKSAAAQHCARFGTLASRNGTAFPVAGSYDGYDAILLSEQLLDQPFGVRIGTGATVRLLNASGRSVSGGLGYVEGTPSYVLEAVIRGVSENEAKALNDGLDGPALGAPPGQDDTRGQVTYGGGDSAKPREVHIYIMRQ